MVLESFLHGVILVQKLAQMCIFVALGSGALGGLVGQ